MEMTIFGSRYFLITMIRSGSKSPKLRYCVVTFLRFWNRYVMKKSITYKEAKKIVLAIFLLNLIVESINLGNPGPSTYKTDEFGGDLRMRKSQDLDAAPLRKNILNCRKRNKNGRRNGNLILHDKRECPLFEETWNRKIYKEKINSNHLTSQNGTDLNYPPNSIQGCQIHKQKSTYDTIHITFQFFTEVKIEIKK